MAKEGKNWNIIVCGDFDKPFAIVVPDPAEFKVTDLKKKVSEMTSIPENEQTFLKRRNLRMEKHLQGVGLKMK